MTLRLSKIRTLAGISECAALSDKPSLDEVSQSLMGRQTTEPGSKLMCM